MKLGEVQAAEKPNPITCPVCGAPAWPTGRTIAACTRCNWILKKEAKSQKEVETDMTEVAQLQWKNAECPIARETFRVVAAVMPKGYVRRLCD